MDAATRLLAEKLAAIASAAEEEIAPLVIKAEAAADICEDYQAEIRDALAEVVHDLRRIAGQLYRLEPPSQVASPDEVP
jgi:hypothetical protein